MEDMAYTALYTQEISLDPRLISQKDIRKMAVYKSVDMCIKDVF